MRKIHLLLYNAILSQEKIVKFKYLLFLIPFVAFAEQDNSKELISAYFPENVVNETLPLANVPRDRWVVINQELCAKSGE